LFLMVMLEGTVLTLLGSMVGVMMGHGVLALLASLVEETQKSGVSAWVWYSEETIVLAGSLVLGWCCALIPAIQAYRTDISRVLAGA